MISGGGSESIDGEYIMSHIQDDRVFEIFNPLDHNDSNYGVVTKSECKEVYEKYKKKYSDKKIKWMNGKEYEHSSKNSSSSVYKKVVWHCKDKCKECIKKEGAEEEYKQCKKLYYGCIEECDNDAAATASCGDGYYFTEKVKLDAEWNKLINFSPEISIPFAGSNYAITHPSKDSLLALPGATIYVKSDSIHIPVHILDWKWDPSVSLGLKNSYDQLLISKQLIMMFLAAALIILLFVFGYKKDKKVQSGLGNLLEVFVVFIRDEVVYPNMGKTQGRRFLPLILTFFFFIVTLNLLGLIPGSATATASFSFTVGMALITFFTYIIFGNKDFWKHIFATPGVPFWLLPIMIPVELIGLLTKPFALSVRLLANMNAGHIIIAAFLGIIINMGKPAVAIGSVPMAIAINMLEIFVAFLQGYIFSLLSSIFIGMAVMEHEHH